MDGKYWLISRHGFLSFSYNKSMYKGIKKETAFRRDEARVWTGVKKSDEVFMQKKLCSQIRRKENQLSSNNPKQILNRVILLLLRFYHLLELYLSFLSLGCVHKA